jgi:HMG (high mobility group) box
VYWHRPQVVNAIVDSTGAIINYSTNTAQGQGIIQQRVINTGGQIQRGVQQMAKPIGKPIKDPNAPKKPLSAYFLYSQEERLKVKAEFPDYSITEIAKELGRRWANLDPNLKHSYEQRYQVLMLLKTSLSGIFKNWQCFFEKLLVTVTKNCNVLTSN